MFPAQVSNLTMSHSDDIKFWVIISLTICKINEEWYILHVINWNNLKENGSSAGTDGRGNFPRSVGRRGNESGARMHRRDALVSKQSRRRDAPCAYIDGDAEGPFLSHSRCGLVASAGISFAVVCASQAPVDAPGPYWCRCIRRLSLALLSAPFSVLASRIRATRTCSRELE